MDSGFVNSAEFELHPGNFDGDAFEAVYRAYWRRLYDFALSKVHDTDVAEEIVQELFVTLWEKRLELRVVNLQGYLFASTRNRVIDYYKQRLFSDLEQADQTVAPDYPLFLNELENRLTEALGRLPFKTREIFRLNRLEGRSAGEISAVLDLPKRTVEYHITQAVRQLRSILRDVVTLLSLVTSHIIF